MNYIPEIPESTCMVFVENEVDKRNKLYKKVKDNGYAAELKKQDADQLMRWAAACSSNERSLCSSLVTGGNCSFNLFHISFYLRSDRFVSGSLCFSY